MSSQAQTIDKFSIDSGGNNVAIDNIHVLYTIGEVIVQEFNMGNLQVSSGFINSDNSSTLGLTPITNSTYNLIVYPNPASAYIFIKSDIPIDSIEIYNVLGSKVIETKLKTINVYNLQSGLYLIKIVSKNKKVTKKVLIQ